MTMAYRDISSDRYSNIKDRTIRFEGQVLRMRKETMLRFSEPLLSTFVFSSSTSTLPVLLGSNSDMAMLVK